MEAQGQRFVDGLNLCFGDLPDPRVVGRTSHLLIDILAITILATFCGAQDWPDIEQFGKSRLAELKAFLQLPNGIPSHDTFRRVLGMIKREAFATGLFRWTQALHEALGGQGIAIDGKVLRRSFSKKSSLKALHLVTAWATQSGLTLGQIACNEKSNEITAIPNLLELLELRGITVTIDAMGCQREIAAQIRKQKGHYVLALKGNQSGLQDDMQAIMLEALEEDYATTPHTRFETDETGHGRREQRVGYAVEIPKDHPQRKQWKDLNTLLILSRGRTTKKSSDWETQLYISSAPANSKKLMNAVRRHWSIENTQHWILDMAYDEDHRRQQDRIGAANLAAVRRFCLSLIRQEKTNKRGVKNKQLQCAWDFNYLLKVLETAKF